VTLIVNVVTEDVPEQPIVLGAAVMVTDEAVVAEPACTVGQTTGLGTPGASSPGVPPPEQVVEPGPTQVIEPVEPPRENSAAPCDTQIAVALIAPLALQLAEEEPAPATVWPLIVTAVRFAWPVTASCVPDVQVPLIVAPVPPLIGVTVRGPPVPVAPPEPPQFRVRVAALAPACAT